MTTFYLCDKGGRLVLDAQTHGDALKEITAKNWIEARAQLPLEYFERKEGYGYPTENYQ